MASEPCQAPATPRSASTLNLRMDNDLLGGTGQDQGYSNGILATLVSP
ncbi:TPA: lipid A deacylase LpxR family protein, partial [Pseudomonas aeruginosa]|nr:lipid A deacylase LpxR family protein [Pseudomonas aeruginosa]